MIAGTAQDGGMGCNLAGRALLHIGPAWLKVLHAPVPRVGNGACFWGHIWASTRHTRPRRPSLTPPTTDLSSVPPGRTWVKGPILVWSRRPGRVHRAQGLVVWAPRAAGVPEHCPGRGWPLRSDGGSHLLCPSAYSRTGGRGARHRPILGTPHPICSLPWPLAQWP